MDGEMKNGAGRPHSTALPRLASATEMTLRALLRNTWLLFWFAENEDKKLPPGNHPKVTCRRQMKR
jgi:hypothetical protein